MKRPRTDSDSYNERETVARREAALARALSTPHKPHKPLKAKKKAKKRPPK